jgi:hypothetical protein
MSALTARAVSWTESGRVPDSVIRAGIRRLIESKRKEIWCPTLRMSSTTRCRPTSLPR